MGTDAGTDTSEKAPIGGRTSLTLLDTWLEAMDGETLCLTGKVTDCWQPVDGTQENASFYLKDLSIEADASSFVFSGDSAETTDNLSQISGSADADQMSILISSQKTTSQINEMQEIFGKNASALCYLQEDETLPKAGSYVRVFGEVSPFLQATNPGEFDAAAYYRRKDCLFALRKTKITAQTKTYGRLEEFLSQLRYESEVLFRKLLGEKNGATASAMVLGRKKGMDSEVKALYQGAGISHLLAISGLHLSLIGAGLFGLLKKVRLPVALSAGISTWILIVYAQLTGMGISTRRALVMFLLFLAAGLLKRTPDLPTSLAVAALLLLVPKPQRILDAGFQLSFSAVIGIAVMIPVLQDGWEKAAPSLRVANRVTDGVAGWNIARAAIARACRLLRKNILAGLGITMTMLPFLLIQKIDELKKDGTIQDDVIIQTGFSTYEPKYCKWSKLIPYQQMVKNVADARIVITHGGPASFIMPLQVGKTPIVVPRQHQFNEHVNDHQVEFARNVSKRMGTIIDVEDIETLGDTITNYDQIVADMGHGMSSNNAKFNEELEKLVDKLF